MQLTILVSTVLLTLVAGVMAAEAVLRVTLGLVTLRISRIHRRTRAVKCSRCTTAFR